MRTWALGLCVLVLVLAWFGPLPRLAAHSFAAHMTLHMLVVAAAAPLVALAIGGSEVDPVARWPYMFPPVIASVLELIVVWLWHTPNFHHWARHTSSGFIVEQGFFLLSGTWLWMSACGGPGWNNPAAAEMAGERRAAGVLALLLTSMHMTLLGALLLLSPRLLFAVHSHAGSTAEALYDQQLGGCIMLIGGGLAYLVGGLALVWKLLAGHRVDRTESS